MKLLFEIIVLEVFKLALVFLADVIASVFIRDIEVGKVYFDILGGMGDDRLVMRRII